MTLAVTGATGFVGQALLDRAMAADVPVRALTRRDQPNRAGITWIAGDLGNMAALDQLVDGTTAVIHVAGVVNAPDVHGFESGNVTGTRNVIEAAQKAGVRRFVHVSSLSAREARLSMYGASKERAERLVMASGLDWTIVRPPAIYGPRDGEMLDLFKVARRGFVPMPQREGRASYIHVDDLARLLLELVPGGDAVSGRIFEPDDGRHNGWSHREIARAIGWAVGRRPLVVHLSPPVLALAGRLSRRFLGSRAKLTPDRASYMSHPDWVSSPAAKVPDTIWKPEIPTREGLKATVAWYRSNDWL